MTKLIKYEWRKQRTTRMVILSALGVGLLVYLWGLIFRKDTLAAVSLMVMFSVALMVLFYTGIESILILNRDLRTRQSYMIWMVPRSAWEVVGAKFISAVLQMLFSFGIYFLAGCVCAAALVYVSDGAKQVLEAAQIIMDSFFERVDVFYLLWFTATFVIAWIEVIMVGFLSVIISRTLLLDSRFAGGFSLILFFVIVWIVERGNHLVDILVSAVDTGSGILSGWNMIYYFLVCVLLFLASGWLADRKLSV